MVQYAKQFWTAILKLTLCVKVSNTIKNKPKTLVNHYAQLWHELNESKDVNKRKMFYNLVRSRFNKHQNPNDFFFLLRTSYNGLVRYNSAGKYNVSLHFTRRGINPQKIKKIVLEWSQKIQKVKFVCCDYKKIQLFVFFDPPCFASCSTMYQGGINFEELTQFLSQLKCKWCMTLDGKTTTKDFTNSLDSKLFDKHVYLSASNSSFSRLKGQTSVKVNESLYIKN